MFDLAAALPRLLPHAVAWAEARSTEIMESGAVLSASELRLAQAAGVACRDRIRICIVPRMPLPDDAELRHAFRQSDLLGPNTLGLTLGYGIYILQGYRTNHLVSHECRHVHQYESAGSIAAFLPAYLQQVAACGYEYAPLEIDARRYERDC